MHYRLGHTALVRFSTGLEDGTKGWALYNAFEVGTHGPG